MPSIYIDGAWVEAASGETREITCPADGSHVITVSEGAEADAKKAIAAARRTFDDGAWSATPAKERGAILDKLADLLERDKDKVARVESQDTGKRFVESQYDMDDIIGVFRHFAALADKEAGRVVDTGMPNVASRVVTEPVGVCSLITPWNYPLLQTAWKIAPAIAAGNTFVLKPAELTPQSSMWLMEALAEAGLPAGVANLVTGPGATVGSEMTTNEDVDLVSFTGGLATGRAIMAAAAPTVKKIALELGGKNPNVLFADADIPAAIDNALTAVFLDSGQVCSAGTRLVVEESIHDEVVTELVRRAELIRLGGPFDDNAETGPLISEAHLEKVDTYVKEAIEAAHRRQARRGRAREGLLLPADDPRRLRQLDALRPRRVLRPRAHRRDVLRRRRQVRRGRRRRHRERHDLRPGRRSLDAERRACRAHGAPPASRNRVDQRLPPLRAAGRVGRHEAERYRPRARRARTRRVPRDQAHLAQHRPRTGRLVQRPRELTCRARLGPSSTHIAPGEVRPVEPTIRFQVLERTLWGRVRSRTTM